MLTGASAGIGRATALAFARRGWRVALLARGQAGLEGARQDVVRGGGSALVMSVDVADADAVFAAADQVVRHWGHIDVWINNAMATVFGSAERVPAEEWRRVTDVTYLGAVHGTLAALRHMGRSGGGTVVQVGSALAYRSIPLQAPYCAAKAALRGFTDSLRCELLHDRSSVRLTMVHLPGVDTPQFSWSRTHMDRRHRPVGAVYRPEVAASAIIKAALEAPRELWVGAPAIETIIGTFLGPGLLDHYLAHAAYEAQLGPKPAGEGEGILDHPAGYDGGMHGLFGDKARPRALTIKPGTLRAALALGALGALAGSYVVGRRSAAPVRPAVDRQDVLS